VAQLVAGGHRVYVERDAGTRAGFPDKDFVQAGATIVYSAEEVYFRSDLIFRVWAPSPTDIDLLQEGQTICCFAYLYSRPTSTIKKLMDRGVSVLAYESIEDRNGRRPILRPMSEIAGRMVPQIAAFLLQSPRGRGVLLSGIPGVLPAEVVVLGAGEVGFNAARAFAGVGAQVTVLDSAERLVELDRIFDVSGRLGLQYAGPHQIESAVCKADVVIGAVMLPEQRSPVLVSEEMVRNMAAGSVIIDVSINEGGCVETSRPTTLEHPTYVKHDVIHCCLPSIPSLVARTATEAMSITTRPYLQRLADKPSILGTDPELRSGLRIYKGKIVNKQLADIHHQPVFDLEDLI
jgi:alanine dehydrogenase